MRLALIAAVAAVSDASAASAQSWTSYGDVQVRPYSYETGRYYTSPYDLDRRAYGRDRTYNGQADRPGDYRCDAFWDANRTDCGAAWRDQRHRTSYGSGYGYRTGYGYSYAQGGYGYGSHYAPGRYSYGRGYGSAAGHGGGIVYPGAYGRPDIVYPGGHGGGGHAGGRDPARIDWCRWNYRSYDPASGYYRAYSGRLVWCG